MPRSAPDKAAVLARAAALQQAFVGAGAAPLHLPVLQPAEALLDLYGEDIRARAYVTSDPVLGEQMLRPDFTVPVAQRHMATHQAQPGGAPACYTYLGEVFRRQETAQRGRANEYLQVGYERFGDTDPAEADARVFALFAGLLAPLGLRPALGDIGLLRAAVAGLGTSPARKAALMRHLWRPRRFRALLDRFAGRSAPLPSRVALLGAVAGQGVEAVLDAAGPEIGQRGRAEVARRIAALQADAQEPPIPAAQVALLDDLMALRETCPNALAHLSNIAVDMPAILPALMRLEARLAALSARGIDVDTLDFEASYGRTTMEYYDGFVFGFMVPGRPDLPPVASGGRYDALTRVLGQANGQGAGVPAVGGVIRPELVVALEAGEGAR